MDAKGILRELWLTLLDTLECGDLPGHLRAWWEVATGQVTVETRWGEAR